MGHVPAMAATACPGAPATVQNRNLMAPTQRRLAPMGASPRIGCPEVTLGNGGPGGREEGAAMLI